MASNGSEIRALLEHRVNACQAKDIDRLMALYSSDIVYFDVVPPLQFTGSAEVRRNFVRWFDEYDGPIGLETHDLNIATSGVVAFAYMLHLDTEIQNMTANDVLQAMARRRANTHIAPTTVDTPTPTHIVTPGADDASQPAIAPAITTMNAAETKPFQEMLRLDETDVSSPLTTRSGPTMRCHPITIGYRVSA